MFTLWTISLPECRVCFLHYCILPRLFSLQWALVLWCMVCACMFHCSVTLNLANSHGLQPTGFLCLWRGLLLSPGITLIQGLNTGLMQWQEDSFTTKWPGKPMVPGQDFTVLYCICQGWGLYHDTEQVSETKNISQFFRLSFLKL